MTFLPACLPDFSLTLFIYKHLLSAIICQNQKLKFGGFIVRNLVVFFWSREWEGIGDADT